MAGPGRRPPASSTEHATSAKVTAKLAASESAHRYRGFPSRPKAAKNAAAHRRDLLLRRRRWFERRRSRVAHCSHELYRLVPSAPLSTLRQPGSQKRPQVLTRPTSYRYFNPHCLLNVGYCVNFGRKFWEHIHRFTGRSCVNLPGRFRMMLLRDMRTKHVNDGTWVSFG